MNKIPCHTLKRLILLSVGLIPLVPSVAQQVTTPDLRESKAFYEERSKKQKTAAWILLGSGIAMTVGGALAFDNSYDIANSKSDFYGFVTVGGVVSSLISIPFFVGSRTNARKAATLNLRTRTFMPLPKHSNRVDSKPGITVLVKF